MAQIRKGVQQKFKENATRARWFGGIFYPESLPANWKEYLIEQGCQFAVSPLHDKDVNPDGELKKAHYHVALYFHGKKSLQQVKEITDYLNQPAPQIIKNHVGVIRYFFHLDNPEKAQYSQTDFYAVGIDVLEIIKTSADKKMADRQFKCELSDIIRDLHFDKLIPLLDFLRDNDKIAHFDWATDHIIITRELLKSNWMENKSNAKPYD